MRRCSIACEIHVNLSELHVQSKRDRFLPIKKGFLTSESIELSVIEKFL